MAAPPTVAPLTAELYGALPELYRNADAAQADGPSNYPLLRYLSLIVDQLQPTGDIVDRLRFTPLDEFADVDPGNGFGVSAWPRTFRTGTYGAGTFGTASGRPDARADVSSDLVTAADADAGWFPWLAQLLGVTLTEGSTIAQQRATLADPATTWAHGTPAVIAAAAEEALPEGSVVNVVPHYAGDVFTIGLTSTADPGAPTATWGGLKAAAPTWGDLKAVGSFGAAHGGAVVALRAIRSAEKERPAGYRYAYAAV
jgi:hypothetical protein